MGKLTVKQLDNLTTPGRYGDGDGLWFQVRRPDAATKALNAGPAQSWLFRYTKQGKQRALGLGPYPLIGLADAQRAANDAARAVLAGGDPIAERRAREADAKRQQDARMTFDGVLKLYLAAHQHTWKNAKHRRQWINTLQSYAFPVFGTWPLQNVDIGAVMKVIEPLWTTKTETASRLRGRIETLLDYATARGWRTGENPARWQGHMENLLPKRADVAKVEHHAALPWAEIGAFMAALHKLPGTGPLALQFVILTAARTGEVIGAKWSEIDLAAAMWTIPAERMKAKRQHRVPLTDAALAVLGAMLPSRPEHSDGFVFPGRKDGAGLSNMSLAAVLKRMGHGELTVHGFRSAFRQWAGERTTVAREVAEAALAHTIKDKTEAAYARSDLIDRRRRLMEQWAAFCAAIEAPAGAVVPILVAA